MRVLYVSKALGVAAYRDKIRELGRRVDVTAVTPERWGEGEPEASPPGVPEPARVPTRLHGRNHLHFYRRPGEWLDASAPDLVHVDEEPYSLVTLQLGALCRRRGVPFLFFAWQNLPKRLPPPFGALRSRVYRMAAGGIAGTRGAADVLEATGFRGPTAVIPQFGVDLERFRPDPEARADARRRESIPDDAFVVGYGGRLVPEKGVAVLIDAFARLGGAHGGAEGASRAGGDRPAAPWLVVVGDGPERPALERATARAGVADRVRFAGQRPSLEMPAWLAALDVLVLPTVGTASWSEQFGRILVEAMACGVPVIGSRCGEIPEVIGDAGSIVERGDAAGLAAEVERLRGDAALRACRATAGRARVGERFTQEVIVRDTVRLYEAVVPAVAGSPA